MQQFKIPPAGIKDINRSTMRKLLPFAVIVVGILTVTGSLDERGEFSLQMLFFMLLISAVLITLAFSFVLKRGRTSLESYTLTFTNNFIKREQLNLQPVAIYLSEVSEIKKQKNGGFIVKGADAASVIHIPPQIERYAEVESILNGIKAPV
jgi:hypothetical protein